MVDATFQRERLADLWSELMPLLEKHWREVAHYQDIALDPDKAAYDAIEKAGALRCFTARAPDWSLIGYSVYFVRANPHYKSSVQANQDVLFLLPEHRRSRIGMQLINWCDQQLKAEGVQAVYQHVKVAHNFGPLLERLGYEAVDVIYARRLDR